MNELEAKFYQAVYLGWLAHGTYTPAECHKYAVDAVAAFRDAHTKLS